ncbi:hypothetical protein [Methanobrevibacter arboriphilus]|nr:hypothetical protein [Methanobrevibacter arboriphilus]
MPGKIYEYLAAKRPVLSIGYKEGSLKDLIEKNRDWISCFNIRRNKKIVL